MDTPLFKKITNKYVDPKITEIKNMGVDIKNTDIIYIAKDNSDECIKLVNTYGKYTKLFILYIPKKFDFNKFVKSIEYDNTDIYYSNSIKYKYYIVVNVIK